MDLQALEWPSANRAALPTLQIGTASGNMTPDNNDNYTDETKTQSISQWMQEGQVDLAHMMRRYDADLGCVLQVEYAVTDVVRGLGKK